MIICFQCSRETRASLDRILSTRQYRDYSEIISVAVGNLEALHHEMQLRGTSLIVGDDLRAPNTLHSVAESTPLPWLAGNGASEEEVTEDRIPQAKPTESASGVPTVFRRSACPKLSVPLAPLPDDVWASGQDVPLQRWVFGQYNKLLPAKTSVRGLLYLLTQQSKGVPLEEAASWIADHAAMLGDYLALHDEVHSIARDEALATAFPSTREDAEKGRMRYAHHFVATMNKQGQLSGLLIDLKLINRIGKKGGPLMLTEVGWHFATMPNPVLDGGQHTPTQKFSEEEIDFLLGHIGRSIPAEDFAYRTIISAIANGADSPEKLDSALRKYVGSTANHNISESFLSSQRSGAVSRMVDLELVTRVRDGVRVSYVLTERGARYIQCSQ